MAEFHANQASTSWWSSSARPPLAAGELVLQTTWPEHPAARLVAIAGQTDNEMALLVPIAYVFQQAQKDGSQSSKTRHCTSRHRRG